MTKTVVISGHAARQAALRGISTEAVVQKVEQVFDRVARSKAREVRVLVARLPRVVQAPDGSRGSLVVACIEPRSMTVKTVMYRLPGQTGARDIQDIGF